jgi:hypothetical protein
VSSRVPSGSRSWRSSPSTSLRVPPMAVERFKHRQLAPTVGLSSRSSGEFEGPSSLISIYSACSSRHITATHASIKTNQPIAIQLRCLLSGSCIAQRIRRVRHKEGRTTRSGTAHTTLTRSPGLLFSVLNSGTKLPTRQARNRAIM